MITPAQIERTIAAINERGLTFPVPAYKALWIEGVGQAMLAALRSRGLVSDEQQPPYISEARIQCREKRLKFCKKAILWHERGIKSRLREIDRLEKELAELASIRKR